MPATATRYYYHQRAAINQQAVTATRDFNPPLQMTAQQGQIQGREVGYGYGLDQTGRTS